MFPMRIKMGPSRNSEWRCCFCLHVRTATILLGIWHLILHVVALSVLALIMRNHQQRLMEQGNIDDIEPNNLLPTPLSKVKDSDNPYYLPTTQDGRTPYSSDMDMGALMTVCTLAITLLLVYGTIKGKATHLLPFFCLQLFDFAITTLTLMGYICYLHSTHNFVVEHWHNLPFRKELLQLSPQYLCLLVLLAFLITMLWKAYCIAIVWRCYTFLTLRKEAMRNTVHYILPGEGGDRLPEPDYSSLLPDYEAACASVLKQPPPPSYAAAMAGQLPVYPGDPHVNVVTVQSEAVAPTNTAVATNNNNEDETPSSNDNDANNETPAVAAQSQNAEGAAIMPANEKEGKEGEDKKPAAN